VNIAFIVTDLTNTRIGGISRVATEVGGNLVRQGHKVTAYVLRRSPDQQSREFEGIHLRYIDRFPTLNSDYPVVGFSYRAFSRLAKDQKHDQYDIVQTFNINAIGLCRFHRQVEGHTPRVVVASYETIMMDVAAKTRELVSLPSLRTLLQIVAEYYLSVGHESRYLRRSDAIITEDDNTRRALTHMGILANRITIIPSGVDVEHARSAQPAAIPTFPSSGGPVIGYLGRVDPRKGVQYLVEAMPRVHSVFPDARLVLAGGSRHGYDRVIRELIERQGLADRVHLLGGIAGDILPYYKLMDLVVIPSLSEGIPITLGEAMAAEVPVVITRLPGVVPFIEPPDLVHWSDIASSESLAESIIAALKDPGRGTRIKRAADFIADYTWAKVARRYAEVYAAQLDRTPP